MMMHLLFLGGTSVCQFIQAEIEQFQVEAIPKYCASLVKKRAYSKVQFGGQQL
jgi:hypothetical protein